MKQKLLKRWNFLNDHYASDVFREIREMPQWVKASLFLVVWVFFGKKNHIFMAASCDIAKGWLADRTFASSCASCSSTAVQRTLS